MSKRSAEEPAAEPEKKPKPAESGGACSWGSGGGACSWGSGGGACSWGSGGGGGGFASAASGGGFAAVASAGTGFGGVAAAAPAAAGFGALSSTGAGFASEVAPTKDGATFGADDGAAEQEEPETVVEAASTGEEDELCVHRVRAKLFRLEVRMERPRRPHAGGTPASKEAAAGAAEEAPAEAAAESQAASTAGAKTGEAAGEAAKDAKAAAADAAEAAKKSTLNPDAPAFVPKAAAAEEKAAGEEEGEEDDAPAVPEEEEGEEGEKVEVTRWAERGVGQCRILVPKPSSSADGADPHPRLVMRVEHVGRLILNEVLLPSTAPAERVSDTSLRLVVVGAGGAPQSYLLRLKYPEEAETLLSKINKTIPSQ